MRFSALKILTEGLTGNRGWGAHWRDPEPAARLARYAAVTDVSNAWCIIDISGVSVLNVLARVTPLDVRAKSFNIGMIQCSMVMHMQASITCLGKSEFRVMVFRSMVRTLVHDLTIAMESVAAREKKV